MLHLRDSYTGVSCAGAIRHLRTQSSTLPRCWRHGYIQATAGRGERPGSAQSLPIGRHGDADIGRYPGAFRTLSRDQPPHCGRVHVNGVEHETDEKTTAGERWWDACADWRISSKG